MQGVAPPEAVTSWLSTYHLLNLSSGGNFNSAAEIHFENPLVSTYHHLELLGYKVNEEEIILSS